MKNSLTSFIVVPEFCRLQISQSSFCVITYGSFSGKGGNSVFRVYKHVLKALSEKYGKFACSNANTDLRLSHNIMTHNLDKRIVLEVFQKGCDCPITVKIYRRFDYSDMCFPKAFKEFRQIRDSLMVINRKLKIIELNDEIFRLNNNLDIDPNLPF